MSWLLVANGTPRDVAVGSITVEAHSTARLLVPDPADVVTAVEQGAAVAAAEGLPADELLESAQLLGKLLPSALG